VSIPSRAGELGRGKERLEVLECACPTLGPPLATSPWARLAISARPMSPWRRQPQVPPRNLKLAPPRRHRGLGGIVKRGLGGIVIWLDAVGTTFLLEVEQAVCMKSQLEISTDPERGGVGLWGGDEAAPNGML
jgi:hypothetical protein